MGSFNIKKGTSTFEFDTFGKVKKDNAAFGTWSTSKDNKIVAKGTSGAQELFDVAWKFNNFNQICLRTADSADKLIFNFHDNDVVVPFFAAENAVLQVWPDAQEDFHFALRGEWDLTTTHDLSITINNVVSVIDGYIDDPESRFSYHFFDRAKNPFNIIFSGTWEHAPTSQGNQMMNFKYNREDGTADTFSLPGEITIDHGINQFVYEYDKKNKRRRIRFAGLLNITKDFQITYSIDRQEATDGSGAVGSTEFKIGAVLVTDKFQGELLEFRVKKADGSQGKTTLSIRGQFKAQLGNAQIEVGFSFLQERTPGVPTRTEIMFAGKLTLHSSLTQVQWEFGLAQNVKTLTITISDVKLGSSVNVDSKLIVKSGPNERAVLFLLGFKF